jgi:hypothetical protein
MPTIDSPEEAQSVARLIQGGQITGDARNMAIQALRDFDAKQPAPAAAPQPTAAEPSIWMSPVGGAEMLLKRITGAAGSIPAGVAYGGAALGKAFGADVNPGDVQRRVQQSLTYEPVTASGQAGERALSGLLSPIVKPIAQAADRFATSVGQQVSPTAESALREAPSAFQATLGIMPATSLVRPGLTAISDATNAVRNGATAIQRRFSTPPSPESVLQQSYSNTPQSMGAAAAAPSITNVSPDLRQAISRAAQKTGGAINPEVLDRHLEAQSLPVKIDLTEGQATRFPAIYSEEQNLRGKHTALADKYNDQNAKLVQNVQTLRDQVGPDVFSANTVEHGDTLIKAYQDVDAARKADIKAKYQALNDANGGNFPVDGQAFVKAADAALAKQMKGRYVPSEIKSDMSDFREGKPMTFENFENMRTNLAAEARKAERSGDGNAMGAVNLVREQLESLPMTAETANIKPLADAARAAAKARFDALKADPAYKAAVYGTVTPDRFVSRFVINGARDNVDRMAQALAGDNTARQTLSVAAIDHLRDAAGLGSDYKGSFKQAGYNRALQALDAKLGSLVDPKTADTLQTLGNVAHNIQAPPAGHTVNTSNTLTAGMSDYATGALERMANAKAGGLPVGTAIRKIGQNIQYGARVRQAIEPGAGLGLLKPASLDGGLLGPLQ